MHEYKFSNLFIGLVVYNFVYNIVYSDVCHCLYIKFNDMAYRIWIGTELLDQYRKLTRVQNRFSWYNILNVLIHGVSILIPENDYITKSKITCWYQAKKQDHETAINLIKYSIQYIELRKTF
jgi:hypothetical protein